MFRNGIGACRYWACASLLGSLLMLTSADAACAGYTPRQISGWTVLVNDELTRDHPATAARCLKRLELELKRASRLLPAHALPVLKQVKIWFDWDDPHENRGTYHPSRGWLIANHRNPRLAKSIQFGNAKNFLMGFKEQPMLVIHELAHAYHDHVLGYVNAEVDAAYGRTEVSRIYASVRHVSGQMLRAYALDKAQEYFAELSEAYFGTNDYYPFNRGDLLLHDPAGYAMIEKMWDVHGKGRNNSAFERSCSQEPNLHSNDAKTAVNVSFKNDRPDSVKLFWLDYGGRRASHGVIAPSAAIDHDTYAGHPWLVTDMNDNCLRIFVPPPRATAFDIR